jgi:hypothetical protein
VAPKSPVLTALGLRGRAESDQRRRATRGRPGLGIRSRTDRSIGRWEFEDYKGLGRERKTPRSQERLSESVASTAYQLEGSRPALLERPRPPSRVLLVRALELTDQRARRARLLGRGDVARVLRVVQVQVVRRRPPARSGNPTHCWRDARAALSCRSPPRREERALDSVRFARSRADRRGPRTRRRPRSVGCITSPMVSFDAPPSRVRRQRRSRPGSRPGASTGATGRRNEQSWAHATRVTPSVATTS